MSKYSRSVTLTVKLLGLKSVGNLKILENALEKLMKTASSKVFLSAVFLCVVVVA